MFKWKFFTRWFAKDCWSFWSWSNSRSFKWQKWGSVVWFTSKQINAQNIIVNNSECTGFLMWFSCYCISWIFKPTKKSKYLYCHLAYDENHVTPIQHTKKINGTASVVEAISKIQKKCKSPRHNRKQFLSCSCKMVTKIKKIIKNQPQKQSYETIKEEKVIRKTTSKGYHKKTRATNKTSKELQRNKIC